MKLLHSLSLLPLLWIASACSQDKPAPGASGPVRPAIPDTVWSSTALAEAKPVAEVRKAAKDGSAVTITGRVKDFVASRAVFTLIDNSLKSCAENEGENCPTPWDYCCIESDVIAANTVTVELRDADGRPLKTGAAGFKGYHDLDHLEYVSVSGTAHRDAQGNVTIAMTKLAKAPKK